MLKIFSTPIVMVSLLIATFLSCSKESVVQSTEFTPQTSIADAQPTQIDTLKIEDDQWQISPDGYSSDLRPFLKGKTIVDVFVSFNSLEVQVSPGKTVEFFGGQLKNSGDQLTFYAPYHQIPFHSLSLTIMVIH